MMFIDTEALKQSLVNSLSANLQSSSTLFFLGNGSYFKVYENSVLLFNGKISRNKIVYRHWVRNPTTTIYFSISPLGFKCYFDR
jgi:hypothetical protein